MLYDFLMLLCPSTNKHQVLTDKDDPGLLQYSREVNPYVGMQTPKIAMNSGTLPHHDDSTFSCETQ